MGEPVHDDQAGGDGGFPQASCRPVQPWLLWLCWQMVCFFKIDFLKWFQICHLSFFYNGKNVENEMASHNYLMHFLFFIPVEIGYSRNTVHSNLESVECT